MKVTIEADIVHDRLVQRFPYGELNEEHCIHGIKLRWSCEKCEDEVEALRSNTPPAIPTETRPSRI